MILGKRLLYSGAVFMTGLIYGMLKYGSSDFTLLLIMSLYTTVLFFLVLSWIKQIKSAIDRLNQWASDYKLWKLAIIAISVVIVWPIVGFLLLIPLVIIIDLL